MSEIATTLQQILQRHLRQVEPGQEIDTAADLMDLGLDSMSAIDLLLDLEKTFSITFPDDLIAADTFRNAESLRQAIESLRQG